MKRLAGPRPARRSARSSPLVRRPKLPVAARASLPSSCRAALRARGRDRRSATMPAARARPRMHVREVPVQRIGPATRTMRSVHRSACCFLVRATLCHSHSMWRSPLCSTPEADSAAPRQRGSRARTPGTMLAAAGTTQQAPAGATRSRARRSQWKPPRAEKAVRMSAPSERVAPGRSMPSSPAFPRAASRCRLPSAPAQPRFEGHRVAGAHDRRDSTARRSRRAR